MTGIQVAWEDVFSAMDLIRNQLIVLAVGLVVLIGLLIVAGKWKKPKRGFIRLQSLVAFVVFAALMVNSICMGPMRNQMELMFGTTGAISEVTAENSKKLVEEISGEGIVLLQNEEHLLPLADTANINVFGWASTNPIYGGTGSGSVDVSTAVDLLGGLSNAGFTANTELTNFYKTYRADRPEITINNGQDWTLPEPTAASYTQEMLDQAKGFSDTAVIVLARCGGEGADLPHDMGAVMDGSYAKGTKYTNASYTNNGDYDDFGQGSTYLELSKTEQDLVELVCRNFDKVTVVYNGANPLEMGWVKDYSQIKSLVVCPGVGATGFNALGKLLKGEINPSGKTTDTWVYDLTATPYYNNIGHFAYDNVQDVTEAAKAHWEKADGVVSFVNYVEGIYVGYRFYETAAAEGLIDYDQVVQYPFGYGLSYTEFEQTMGAVQEQNGILSVDVTVTNTGAVAGKDVVELYYNPPYENGGIEKASTNLAAFAKTGLLEPGASETCTLRFAVQDMASYDDQGHGCYVLEAGDYGISLNRDSHNVLASETYQVASDIVYDSSNPREGDRIPAVNQFDFAEGEVDYLSRRDGFANYQAAIAAPESYSLPSQYEVTGNGTYDVYEHNNDSDVMPVTGAKNGLVLYDLRGKTYEDPMWDQLLDQMSVDDMVEMIGFGGYGSPKIDSVGKLKALDADGPAGINARVAANSDSTKGLGYPSEIVIAATWNTDMAKLAAEGLGAEARDLLVDGWYAPSMNMHRSAFAGRNFEYYSEDPVLSAEMAKAECQGVYEYDLYPFIKHFALNDQETNRNAMCCTWSNEQAIREIYLKPFEACIKDAGENPITVMSSYNYIGSVWAAACPQLQKTVLREEWGHQGMVLSDYFGNYGYMDADKAIRGGTDMMLATAGNDAIITDTTSATSVLAMRQASKNIMYTMVNSYTYNNYDPNVVPAWMMNLYIADAALAAVLIILEVLMIRSYKKKQQNA
ncbi:MAG: glycoside hydrolase family 3 C-terminal domain-containing protein [Lachnospiraceae bacterium]|nr:glycoside hydrolase family 3 C-terminal domain-containing protein [Lachnospiraceae bacterium]